MARILVWDVPVRLAHALLAALFLGAFALATLAPEKSAAFALHAALGVTALFVVALRLAWALVGSRTARFGAFDLRPSALLAHLRGGAARPAGHNPATSWFALALLATLVGLGITGFSLGRGSERFEDVHGVLAWTAIGLVALHLAGLAWHRLRHDENLAPGMVTGRRAGTPAAEIPSARPWSGAAFLLLAVAFGAVVLRGSDLAARRVAVPLAGAPLTIGEAEGRDHGTGDAREDRHDNDDDD